MQLQRAYRAPGASLTTSGMISRPNAGSVASLLIVGGRKPSFIEMIVATIPAAPQAPWGWADHALGARHGDLGGDIPQSPLDGGGLDAVVEVGCRAVKVDVIELLGPDLGVLQGKLDGSDGFFQVDSQGDAVVQASQVLA